MLVTGLREALVDRQGVSYVVRDLEPGDRTALAAMYTAFEPKRVAQGLPPANEPRLTSWLKHVLERGRHLVVEMNGSVLGHVMLIPKAEESDPDAVLELATFLHQTIRGRGLGTVLNALAIRLAREAGAERVWLSVEPGNRAAVRSYERVGFRRLPGSLWLPEIEMECAVKCAV